MCNTYNPLLFASLFFLDFLNKTLPFLGDQLRLSVMYVVLVSVGSMYIETPYINSYIGPRYIETPYISSHMGPMYIETPYISSHMGLVYIETPYINRHRSHVY